MKKRNRKIIFRAAGFLLLLCLSLGGCAGKETSAREVLDAMCHAAGELPAGKLYVLGTPEDDEAHPSDDLLAATFGEGALPRELEEILDGAFYLSYAGVCELAAFRCKTANGAEAVARMCLHRLKKLESRSLSADGSPAGDGSVTIRGRWVIYCFGTDPDAVRRAARRCV